MKVSSLRNNIIFIIYGLGFIFIWTWLSKAVNQSVIVPSPGEVLHSFLEILKVKSTYIGIFYTLKRTLVSFLFSLIFALLAGLIAYALPLFRKLLSPLLYFFKIVPVVAIILLILIWSSSETTPAIVGFLMVFPVLYEGTIHSLLAIDSKLLNMSKVYNVSLVYKLKDLYLPTIFFGIAHHFSSAFGLIFKSIVAGEVLSHPKFSIGGAIYREKNYLNTSGVLAWLIIMVIINILLEFTFKRLRGDQYRNSKS